MGVARHMPEKRQPLSIRLPAPLEAKLACYATQHGIPIRAALLKAAEEGMSATPRATPTNPKQILAEALASTNHLGITLTPPPKPKRRW